MERTREFRDHGEGLKAIQCFPLGRELGGSKEAGQESSRLARMGRNSVLKRQETKGYLTQLPPLRCAHSSVTLSNRTGNVCCHCPGEYRPAGIKGRAMSFLEKKAPLILGSGPARPMTVRSSSACAQPVKQVLQACLCCLPSPTPAPNPLPQPPRGSYTTTSLPRLLPCPSPIAVQLGSQFSSVPTMNNCQFSGHSPFSKSICPMPLVLTLTL